MVVVWEDSALDLSQCIGDLGRSVSSELIQGSVDLESPLLHLKLKICEKKPLEISWKIWEPRVDASVINKLDGLNPCDLGQKSVRFREAKLCLCGRVGGWEGVAR